MASRSRFLSILCVASLLVCVVACDDDDDVVVPNQEVSSAQAAALIEDLVPEIVQFSLGVLQLLQATAAPPLVERSVQGLPPCSDMPGIETEFLCTVPSDGQVCPVDATTVDWIFDACDADGTALDGSVRVAGVGPYTLTFDLTIDDIDVMGGMTVTVGAGAARAALGGVCDSLSYDNLDFGMSGVSTTLMGTLTSCGTLPDGDITANVTATGFNPFILEISVNSGFITVVVIDTQTQAPIQYCTCTPDFQDPEAIDCECIPADEY